jgi:peroxiredoxin
MFMKKLFLVAILAGWSALVSGQTMLDTAVNFNVKDTDGQVIELFELLNEGKMVMIDFFATDCNYCHLYAPDFQQAFEAFGCNSSNVFFMSIDQGHTNEEVQDFKALHNLTMPAASGLEGNGNFAWEVFEVVGAPSFVLVGTDTLIIEDQIWPPEADNLIAKITDAGGVQVTCPTPVETTAAPSLVKVYPNPAKERIVIEGIAPQHATIALWTPDGKKIASWYQQNEIALKDIAAGLYILTVDKNQQRMYRQKLFVR